MAEDETLDDASDSRGRMPHVPKPPRDPVVIEGEASEVREAEPAPVEVAHEEASITQTPTEPAQEGLAVEAAAAFPESEIPDPVVPDPATVEPVAEQPAPPMSPPPTPRREGLALGWGAAGAIVGALIALGAAWLFDPRAEPLQALTARLSALEGAGATQSSAAKTWDSRLAALEAIKPAPTDPTALNALDKRLSKLEASEIKPDAFAALQKDTAKALALAGTPSAAPASNAPAAAPDPRLDKLAASDAALSDRVAKLEAALSTPKAEMRVAPTETPKAPDSATQAIAAIALEQRLRAGEPYATEWAALSRSGADAAALATLKPFADSGAPTSAALAAAFAKINSRVLAAAHPDSGGGAVDKLLDHMRKLVREHPVGEAVGDDADALVSQIEAALARGQVSAALAAYAKLPEAARAAGADWAKTAGARAGVDASARVLRDGAIAALDASKN